jgi:hypothetical protein
VAASAEPPHRADGFLPPRKPPVLSLHLFVQSHQLLFGQLEEAEGEDGLDTTGNDGNKPAPSAHRGGLQPLTTVSLQPRTQPPHVHLQSLEMCSLPPPPPLPPRPRLQATDALRALRHGKRRFPLADWCTSTSVLDPTAPGPAAILAPEVPSAVATPAQPLMSIGRLHLSQPRPQVETPEANRSLGAVVARTRLRQLQLASQALGDLQADAGSVVSGGEAFPPSKVNVNTGFTSQPVSPALRSPLDTRGAVLGLPSPTNTAPAANLGGKPSAAVLRLGPPSLAAPTKRTSYRLSKTNCSRLD